MSIEPHGGTLIDRCVTGAKREQLIEEAAGLPKVLLNEWQVSDLDMIACGAMSPLTGFLGEADYRSVVDSMRLADGTPWSLPICLRVDEGAADGADRVALCAADGGLLAVMDVAERYHADKTSEAVKVYRTDEDAHAGVAALYSQGDVALGGEVHVVNRVPYADFLSQRLDPAGIRAVMKERGWETMVGFQTRNPIHRAHEYLIKCALEMVDGALIHPLVGATKADDIPADVRMKCYDILLENYFPADRALLSVFPAAMRYAGPREAIFHA
ncbi:MAG: sulfate adenylyltransferase, partial [Gemmatimonadota bacterium]|nr:sulfate adenylyltransferase [Gemmatimonadota bacterium]